MRAAKLFPELKNKLMLIFATRCVKYENFYSFSYTQLKHTVIISVLYLALGIMMQVRLEITEFRTNLFMSNAYMQTDSEGNLLQNI